MTTSNAVTVALLLISFSQALITAHGRPVRFDLDNPRQLRDSAAGTVGGLNLSAASSDAAAAGSSSGPAGGSGSAYASGSASGSSSGSGSGSGAASGSGSRPGSGAQASAGGDKGNAS